MDYNNMVNFDKRNVDPDCIIKVVGVGGGGGNAVNHMFSGGIEHVSFALCNTEKRVLELSPIPQKLQIGPGLGAGGDPDRAEKIANDYIDDIKELFNDGTQMAFITATMGGGTGTGAGPIVAKVAKEMGILTVGIVTIPFLFEGKPKIVRALDGVDKMSKNVDALLVINNERLRMIYSDLEFFNAFKKADDTLKIAAKSILDIINIPGMIDIDFADVCSTLKEGGGAIICTGYASGENRVQKAIDNALHSPLLNNTDIYKAKRILLNLAITHKSGFLMVELETIHQFMERFNKKVELIWGYAIDNTFDEDIKITILASGFDSKDMDYNYAADDEPDNDDKRIMDAYGSLYDSKSSRKRRIHVHIFSENDLDDDNVISVIDSSPTYSRDPSTLRSIDKQPSKQSQKTANNNSDTITFD